VVFDDRSPIYLQIAEQIKNDIVTGALAEDEQVMSTNQYACSAPADGTRSSPMWSTR